MHGISNSVRYECCVAVGHSLSLRERARVRESKKEALFFTPSS